MTSGPERRKTSDRMGRAATLAVRGPVQGVGGALHPERQISSRDVCSRGYVRQNGTSNAGLSGENCHVSYRLLDEPRALSSCCLRCILHSSR